MSACIYYSDVIAPRFVVTSVVMVPLGNLTHGPAPRSRIDAMEGFGVVEFMAILLGCVTYQPLRVHTIISPEVRQKMRDGRVPGSTNCLEWDAAHVVDNVNRSDLSVMQSSSSSSLDCCSHRFNESTA